MAENKSKAMKMAELSRITGVAPRTIRLYISRGLLEGPSRLGRGAVYGEKHSLRLMEIRRLQTSGLTLQEIARVLAGGKDAIPLPSPESWWHYTLAEDVVVSVKAGASPWRGKLIRKTLVRMAADLMEPKTEDENDEFRD